MTAPERVALAHPLSPFLVGLARRTAPLRRRASRTLEQDRGRGLVLAAGAATFGFGFFAGALLNLYLWAVHAPLAEHFRTSLTYPSAILGDGLVLPVVNMAATAFLLQERARLGRSHGALAALLGMGVTAAFHVQQAVHGMVNWSMPTPWHWNLLGAYHGVYMLTVCSFLCLFLLATVRFVRQEGRLPRASLVVALGVVLFFGLLRLDYAGFV